ncbi:hypothetical protein D3C87_154930 [compost metagenome]
MKLSIVKFFCLTALLLISSNLFSQTKKITETFENASKKGRYPSGEVTTTNGTWTFNEALVWDKEPTDYRPMAPRVLSAPTIDDEAGSISTNFEIKDIKHIKVGFIGYKTDPGYFQIEVLLSKDKGQTWESIGTARGKYDKSQETFAQFKVNSKKDEELRVKIKNASAPKLNKLNRINITLVEIECNK